MKLFIGIILGILLNKAASSAQWYTFYSALKDCKTTELHADMIDCIDKKQGIFHYLGIASGTLTYDPIDGYQWRY